MEEFSAFLKALADESRFKIIDLLLRHDLCVGALAGRLNLSEAAVSQHLQVLRKAGIVKGEKRGYYTHYGVNRDKLKEFAAAITELASRAPQSEESCSQKSETCHGARKEE
ncbi:MAG: metalloregulator ArsR/SmtB family transcription factor [Bacillota bacterium]